MGGGCQEGVGAGFGPSSKQLAIPGRHPQAAAMKFTSAPYGGTRRSVGIAQGCAGYAADRLWVVQGVGVCRVIRGHAEARRAT